MNAIKKVIEKSLKTQKEVCSITEIKQSALSYQMRTEIEGTIEKSIKIAKELGVNNYVVENENYKLTVKIKMN